MMLDTYRFLAWFVIVSLSLEVVAEQGIPREPKSYRVSIVPLTKNIELRSPYYAECRVEPQPPNRVEFVWHFNGRFHSEGERLSIPELNDYTIGEYTCQASIPTSSGSPLIAKARTLIQYQPVSPEHTDLQSYSVSIAPLTQTIERRAPYYAECHIQPTPHYPVRFTWYYKGRYHSEGQRLRIPELNEHTVGKYTCQATIDMPSGKQPVSSGTRSVYYSNTLSGDSGQIQVSIVPLTQQVEHGRPFYADCRISPRPTEPVDYTWYFQGRVFSRGERLRIPELNERTVGEYLCQARFRSAGGSTVEAKATISLRYNSSPSGGQTDPQTYWVSIDPLTDRPTRGSPYYADCRLQPQPPYPVRLTWYFKGRYHSEGQRLSIPELNEYSTGEYTCQATITTPTGTPLNVNATRSIHYASVLPPGVAARFQVNIVPLTPQVEHRRPFYADCRVSPRPTTPVDYTWYFQGRVFSRGERLSIPELNERTVGDYICQARFRPEGGLTVEAKASISLEYNSPPSDGRTDQQTYWVIIDPLTGRPTERAPYYADCRIQPRPPYPTRFTWYFKGRYHSDGQRLSIPQLDDYTTGEYTCQVTITTPTGTPIVANATKSIYYSRVLPPDGADDQTYWLSIDPLTQRMEYRAPYYAECRIQPRPRYPVRFTWYFRGRYHSQGERLSIPELNEHTTGEYICQASIDRPYGSPLLVNASRTVNYQNALPGQVQVSIVPLTQQMEHGRPFYADCRISPRPTEPVDYTWYFQGRVFSRGERLRIPELNERTVGEYLCQARFRSAGGSTVEAKATISLRYNSSPSGPQTYWVSIDPLTERPTRGSPYYADCRLQPQPPYPVRLTWYFKGRYHSEGQRLSIPELNEYSTGEYTCQATITTPTGTPLNVNATRSIHYAAVLPPGVAARFQVNIVPLTPQVEHRRPFYADCRVSPRPTTPVDYTWYFQGRVFSRGERLSIPELNERTVDQQTYWVIIDPLTGRPTERAPYYADCRIQPRPPYPTRFTWYFKGRYHSDGQRLSIPQLDDYTTGEYTCQVTITTPTGTPLVANATKSIYYSRVLPPDGADDQTYWLSIDPLTQRMEYRAPYYAECRIQPRPRYPVRFTWYFRGRYHSQGERLSIPELNEHTTGEYICQASIDRPYGSPLLVNASRTVNYQNALPGQVQVCITPLTQQMEHRRPFYADCRISPRQTEPVDYTWYFQGRVFSRGERLRIPELNERTVGEYTCQARFRSVGGSTVEAKATIFLRYNSSPSGPQTYWVSIDPLTDRPTRGSPYYADCRLQPQPPYPVRLTWYFKGRYHSEGQRLSIPELNEYSTGEYTCQATITTPTGTPLNVNATRSIHYAAVLPPGVADPQTYWVSIDPLIDRPTRGSPYYADCRLQPQPPYPVRLTWYFKGRYHSEGQRLSIPELNEYSTGEYTCQATITTPTGTPLNVNATRSIHYAAVLPPGVAEQIRVSITPLTQQMEHRRPFYADCRVSPRPTAPVDYTWYFQGRVFSRGERLSIPELNERTVGEYLCQARFRSADGSTVEAKATISLGYNTSPFVGRNAAETVRVNIVRLTERMEHRQPFYADCRVSPPSQNPVQYNWYFRGQVYSRGERLTIPELNEHTVGNYTCQVKVIPVTGPPVEAEASLLVNYNQPVSADIQSDQQDYSVSIDPLTENPEYKSPYYAECRITPQPTRPVRFAWYFKGRLHSEDKRLIIRRLHKYNTGDYTCKATTTSPSGTPVEVNATITVRYPSRSANRADPGKIRVSVQPLTREMTYKKPYQAVCLLKPPTRNPVQYTWYFKDRVFAHGDRLMVPELDEDSVGKYICRARVPMPISQPLLENMRRD
ncbi:hypothetical protein AAHC03_013566 [Spirometra sp. Aus1]